jgi:phosphomevalonate kinase
MAPQSGLTGYGLPAYYISSTNRVGLFVVKSDGLIDAEVLYLISDTVEAAKKPFVLINDETSFVMVISTLVLSALRVLGGFV